MSGIHAAISLAGKHEHRDAESGAGGVDHANLADGPVIEPHVFNLVAHEAVAHHAEGAGPGVVADAERGAEARVEALQHAHPLAAALDEPRAGVELVVKQVAHRPVGVIDENVRGAGSERAAHRRVDVLGHHDPAPLVIPAGRLDVLGIHQAGDALHIHGDVDLHPGTLPGPPHSPCRARPPRGFPCQIRRGLEDILGVLRP